MSGEKTLKSPFAPQSAESLPAPPDVVPLSPRGQVALETLPPPGVEQDIDSKLHAAMDKAALKLLEILDNEETDGDGRPKYGLSMKMSAFTKAQEWLARRMKLRAESGDDSGEGVEILRAMTEDPAKIVDRLRDDPKFQAALMDAGWIKEPPRRSVGRRTKQEVEQYRRYTEAKSHWEREAGKEDDSGLAALLEKTGGSNGH